MAKILKLIALMSLTAPKLFGQKSVTDHTIQGPTMCFANELLKLADIKAKGVDIYANSCRMHCIVNKSWKIKSSHYNGSLLMPKKQLVKLLR